MRALIQRVRSAHVISEGKVSGSIEHGLLILLGVGQDDQMEDIHWLSSKILQMRIFADQDQKMNRSVLDVSGGLLVISQFTLFASTKKGNRPGFTAASSGPVAEALYLQFIGELQNKSGRIIQTGIFGADMQVHLVNDGPVTIWMDSRQKE